MRESENANGKAGPARDELVESLERCATAAKAYLRSQVQSTPYLALGGAAFAGYVLGAGVPPRLVGVLFSLVGRNAVAELLGTGAPRR